MLAGFEDFAETCLALPRPVPMVWRPFVDPGDPVVRGAWKGGRPSSRSPRLRADRQLLVTRPKAASCDVPRLDRRVNHLYRSPRSRDI